jgi:hypothetical protein
MPIAASLTRWQPVIDQFDPLVRRAEQLRFAVDGHVSVELHEKLIELLAAGDVDGATSVTYDIWHSLPAEEDTAQQS